MQAFTLVSCYTYEDKPIYLFTCVDAHIFFHKNLGAGYIAAVLMETHCSFLFPVS